MKNKDWVKVSWERRRGLAVRAGKSLVESLMKNYHEPTRAGTPKGNLIGFSRSKRRAALLMILYNPPFGLGLGEIGKIAHVSPAVLRVWRTQSAFKKAESEAYSAVGEMILNTIHNEITGYSPEGIKEPSLLLKGIGQEQARYLLLKLLPFFSPLIAYPVMTVIAKNIKSSIPGYAEFWLLLTWILDVKDKKSYQRWRSRPEIKDLIKEIVATWVDFISDPETRKEMGEETFQETVEKLKTFIFEQLDL